VTNVGSNAEVLGETLARHVVPDGDADALLTALSDSSILRRRERQLAFARATKRRWRVTASGRCSAPTNDCTAERR